MRKSIGPILLGVFLLSINHGILAQSSEERDVDRFSSVGLGIAADLYLSQGSPQKLVIQARDGDQEKIITEVKGDHLRIRSKNWTNSLRDVKIWITVPQVEGLHLSGSGKIIAETDIRTEELEIKVSGSGQIKVNGLDAEEVSSSISGSGDIHLSGTAEEVDIRISGSGSVLGSGLVVEECGLKISGSGNVEIDATRELEAALSGSGRVTYYSNPLIDASISGSGKVRSGSK